MEPDCQSLDLCQHPNLNSHKEANVEPECQSLDLHQHPNQQTHTGTRMPLDGLTSASKHTTRQNKDTGERGARLPITGLMSASEPKHTHTGTQMPLDGLTSASKHTTTQQVNRESGTQPTTVKHKQTDRQQVLRSHRLEPSKGQTTHTKERKGARRDQLNLLPTYFIWCEDQGDVVPLRRDEGSSLTR